MAGSIDFNTATVTGTIPVPDASTTTKGIALKSATISAGAASVLTDNTGGALLTTLPIIAGAIYTTDAPAIKNALASLINAQNATRARLEELIAKQQTAGQQT